ncbi:MAG TPA: hypothetical protein DDW41_05845 [Candidatus Andersenbacteria bacterium]|nr:MAG: hypothetical protein UW94_C0005G0098 [Parcubacteria group bacterium GW2011_GWA2_45_14]HBE90701.1 hypothetical protein [Candidatus Andersenbacteria bacterium]
MKKKQVWLFGNPDFAPDALPLKILPTLKQQLPQFDFIVKDPHEEWILPPRLIIIDTIKGIKSPLVVTSLDAFKNSPRITMHDFDLITNLRWLAKLRRLPPFVIIGLPMDYNLTATLTFVTNQLAALNSNSLPENEPHSSCTGHKP